MEICADCTTRYSVGAPACPHCGGTRRREEGAVGEVPPTITVECTNVGCRHHGKQRLVVLRLVAVGVAELPTLVCTGCGAHLWVTWSGPLAQEEDDMPKITRHGGASIEGTEPQGESVPEVPDAGTLDGGEQSSAGTSSSTSSETQSSTPATSKPGHSKPARTTGSRSKQDRTGGSSAASTDGGQEDGTSGDSDPS